jgi:hypothetical protein
VTASVAPPASGYPRLRPGWVYAAHADGVLLLNTLRKATPLVLRDHSAGLLALLERCTGAVDLGALAAELGWPPARVRALLGELRERDVLTLHPEPVGDPYAVLPRYRRQLEFLEDRLGSPAAALTAQRRLLAAHVTVVGLGGVAHWLLTALAAVGIRRLRLVDPDVVELSNLSRQFLFGLAAVGTPKVDAAADHLRRCDEDFVLDTRRAGVWSVPDAERLLAGTDLAIVTVGHVPSRIATVANRACVAAGTPLLLVGGASVGPLVRPGRSGCLECFERGLRRDSPVTFDSLAAGAPRFPSGTHTPVLATAIAPAAIAAADDVIALFTDHAPARSLGAVVWPADLDNPIRFDRLPDCGVCGGAR